MRAGKILIFLYKNGKFLNYFKKYLMKIYNKTHQIASFFKIYSEEFALEHLCHALHAVSRHANNYTLLEELSARLC